MKPILIGILGLACSNAFGSLVLVGPVDLIGTGFGTATTVLTLQSPANTTVETGCVAPSASGVTTASCGFMDSKAMPGQSHTATPTLASLGMSSALDLGIIFNADQPAGGGITLNDLVLNLYGPDFTKSADFAASATTFSATSSGIGKSGFLFKLDTTQAATAQAFIDAHGGTSAVTIGLGSSLSDATGGPETFFAAQIPAPGSAVPEPRSVPLLASGFLGLALLGIRRKRRG